MTDKADLFFLWFLLHFLRTGKCFIQSFHIIIRSGHLTRNVVSDFAWIPDVTIKADVYWPPLFPDILKTTSEKK